jgi:hypothetical protein
MRQSLQNRINAIRAEIDALIDKKVSEVAKASPGIPAGVLRNLITNRAPECQCRQYAVLEEGTVI